jgi:hypothetical protein
MAYADVSPEAIELARLMQELIRQEVKRQLAESRDTPASPSDRVGRDEAARILGVKPRTIYAYVEQGLLKPARVGPKGGKLMFKRADCERLTAGQP